MCTYVYSMCVVVTLRNVLVCVCAYADKHERNGERDGKSNGERNGKSTTEVRKSGAGIRVMCASKRELLPGAKKTDR